MPQEASNVADGFVGGEGDHTSAAGSSWGSRMAPAILAVGLLALAVSIFFRATGGVTAGVPPVTRSPITLAAPGRGSGDAATHAYGDPDARYHTALQQDLARLRPQHPPLPPPGPGDWLTSHPEGGQTFADYLASGPNRPTASRHTIYVQPLGPFSSAQRQIVRLAAEYLGHYFALKVVIEPDLSAGAIPRSGVRIHPRTHEVQVHTGAILYGVLTPRLPRDAAAYIALTAIDLFPDPRWNFVFGQASPDERVGVWSLARFGDPAASEASFRQVLLRTLKTATHETGHMFGMHHCTAAACNMNGANSLEEADRAPLALCPECLAKTCWLTGTKPSDWLRAQLGFYRRAGLDDDAQRTTTALAALGVAPSAMP